jgi:hypothetical protein
MNAYERYKHLYMKLLSLAANGKLDSPEADALRDDMDPLWEMMTPAQRNAIATLVAMEPPYD